MVVTPPTPAAFVNDAERIVWDALRRQLRPDDVLLHGVRITDAIDGDVEIDILVLMPDLGAAVIEVKGGHVSFGGGSVLQTGADGAHPITPDLQAAKGLRALRRFLERRPTWSHGPVRAAWLVALPYTHAAGGLGPTLPRHALLDADDLAGGDAAGLVFDRLVRNANQHGTPSPHWIAAALDALLGTPDEPATIQARVTERLLLADQLTKRQSALLDAVRLVPRFEVVGAAGTGKTWLAVEQTRRWAKAGERVCFVAYTRGVVESVRATVTALPAAQRPTFVGTFHQLGTDLGIGLDGPHEHSFWVDAAPAAMRERATGLADTERFTAFVVDEAQDFGDAWWPALLASGTIDAKVAVFRDDEQTVFTDRKGRPDVDLVPLVLDVNLRNGQQIVDTFRPLIAAPVTSSAGQGFPVEFVDCEPEHVIDTADDVVVDLLDRRGWLPEHIAVLTTKHRHPVHAEFDQDKAAYWAELWATDDVFYGTVAGFKGLERSAVILAVDGFHPGIDPRNVLYSGMSRARDLLIVVAPSTTLERVDQKLARRLQRGRTTEGT